MCKNEYNSVSGFREDAKLVWNNAFAYNSPGSEIYKISFVLRDKFFETCQEKKLSVIGKVTNRKVLSFFLCVQKSNSI